MKTGVAVPPVRRNARAKLLDAALKLIRTSGYAGTSVEVLCSAAGVTKGAFFHHFRSKDDLGVAAADYWSEITGDFFKSASYHAHECPLQRLLGYVDFRRELVRGATPEFTCLVGTMVQEVYATNPDLRAACEASIVGHAEALESDIAAAMLRYRVTRGWTARSLALHTQAVLQGAFILAKATGDRRVAEDSVCHLRRYIELLFGQAKMKEA